MEKGLVPFFFSANCLIFTPINRSLYYEIEWVGDFRIEVGLDIDNAVVISANRDGLLSLARQLTTLADEPVGFHIHYDDYNSLEDGSIEMIIAKTE